jgi:hypothetical protein
VGIKRDLVRKKLARRADSSLVTGLLAVAAISSARASSPRLVESILDTVGGLPSESVAAIAQGASANGFLLKAKRNSKTSPRFF